jgi:hypothetical protein
MSGISDALSAAGLLLAALALVFSAWSGSIEGAIKDNLGTTDDAVTEKKKEIRAVRRFRALPIAIACWALLVAFLYRDITILRTAWRCLASSKCEYDDIAVIFLLTQVLILGMALHATHQSGEIKKRL